MESMRAAEKGHAVLVPYPTQGHINPLMKLAKLIHSRGFHVTFVNTEFNHNRLIHSKGPDSVKGLPDFRFETIPDGMPPSDLGATQDIPMLCKSIRKTCLEPFKKLLSRLNSTQGVPPVSFVVSDAVMSFGIKAAQELGIPGFQFWTASACSFIACLHYPELVRRGITPFENDDYLTDGTLDTPVDWITGMPGIRLKDIPSFFQTTDPDDIVFNYMREEAQSCLKASAIIFNTFRELEKEALEAVISTFNYTNFYTIGPLPLLSKHVPESEADSLNSSLWKPDPQVLDWLNKQKPESVIYVNYGSITTMTAQNFQEFAWGLAQSKQPFLWIIRGDVVKGDKAMLPREFMEAIEERGLLASWCAQDQVLAHEAVGAFLTHCGWNSNLESISCGVPVICWPFFSDQQTNCHYSCEKWGIGMEIDYDVKRDEVANVVKEMMQREKGKKMRLKAQEWKKLAEDATDVGGGSYIDFYKFIEKGRRYV